MPPGFVEYENRVCARRGLPADPGQVALLEWRWPGNGTLGGTLLRGRTFADSPEAKLMALLDYTGYAAALCTTGAYVPQVLRVWRTRSTQDISLRMFLVLVTGLGLWLIYGLWLGEIPIIAANGVTLVLAGIILYFKIRHG
jgi:MtN3 and saliva related transmembrane protein